MSKLALNGGDRVIKEPFPKYNPIGKEEKDAAIKVLESGVLSGFFGSWNDKFYGGPMVQQFERAWERHFNVKHAISFNSWTSGLIAALGALNLEPGDEVIVSPWTMAATATSILVWNAIPVFADIESETFNLDVASVERNISSRTKAILVPDIFGHPANLRSLKELAAKYDLKVIEDAAQAPNSFYFGKKTGTIADIGGFSLNYHKHIHTGEGGMAVTNDDELAERMRLIRNHAEAVVGPKQYKHLNNMIGFNFRMGEIEAAIGLEQLKKIDYLTGLREETGKKLIYQLSALDGFIPPVIKDHCTHVFYIFAFQLIPEKLQGINRTRIVKALQAEGVPWVYEGYQLIHLLPIFQNKIAYGNGGFPWKSNMHISSVSYEQGICPVSEKLHNQTLVCLQICQHWYTTTEIELVTQAFQKVWENRVELVD